MNSIKTLFILFISILLFEGCSETNLPKPTGYYRIDLPEKKNTLIDSVDFPFQFELPHYARVNLNRNSNEPNFFDIEFPRFSARLHLSYIQVDSNANKLLEDARTLVYKHVAKAQNIKENQVFNPESKVYGTLYQIDGNAASGAQFFLTDSNHHFLRGALYFNVVPNFDSIAPVQDFLVEDISNFIESFRWKHSL